MKHDTRLDFEAVFNSLPSPWLVMDRDFTIVALNQAFLDVTTRSRDELIGIKFFTAFPSAGGKPPHRTRPPLSASATKGVVDVLPLGFLRKLPSMAVPKSVFGAAPMSQSSARTGQVAFLLKNAQDISELHSIESHDGSGFGAPRARPIPRRETSRFSIRRFWRRSSS